jgi:hypothetical protein
MRSPKNKILTVLLLAAAFPVASQGYGNKRFVFNYSPAYSVILTEAIIISPYFVQHHKAELGISLSKRLLFNVNYENARNLNSVDDAPYVKDNTCGISFVFFQNKKGSFAPIGKYVGIGLNYGTQYVRKYKSVSLPYGGTYTASYDKKETAVLFSLYTGQNYIVFDRLFLGYGIQWGVPIDGSETNLRHLGKPYFKLGICF